MSSNHEDETPTAPQPTPPNAWGPQPGTPGPPMSWGPPPGAPDGGWAPGASTQPHGQGQQPWATPQAYGQPQQPHWQPQPSYEQQPYGPGPSGYPPQAVWVPPVPVYPYAHWGRRVGAYLIDFAPAYVAMIPFWVGYVMFYVQLIQLSTRAPSSVDPDEVFGQLAGPAIVWMVIGGVLMLAAIGWQWYNRWLTAGRTGQSMGRRVLKVKLVAEVNGQPIGPVNAFLRDLLHVLDGAAYIGYLWPLWDAKRQTFSDMIMKTVVIDLPVGPAPDASVPAPPGPA